MNNSSNFPKYVMDTNVIIYMHKNTNVASMIAFRMNFVDSTIYIPSQVVEEAQRFGLNHAAMDSTLKRLNATVRYESVTEEMKRDGEAMVDQHPTLHSGDDQVLAFAISKNATLLTHDRGLFMASVAANCNVIDPTLLACPQSESLIKSKMRKTAKATRKVIPSSKNVKTLVLKPGQKIVWSAFK